MKLSEIEGLTLEDYKYLDVIRKIDPNNDFINYIIDRINSNDYRGVQASQHNRLTFKYFCVLLDVIAEVTKGDRFNIHVGDDEGQLQPGAEKYYDIVELVKERSEKGTVNSIKKNTFPDITKMGFIIRFDKYGNVIQEGNTRTSVFSVQLAGLGNRFVGATLFEKIKMFTDGVDKLTSNIGSELAELLYLNDFGIEYLDILEFMYIFSDDRLGITSNDKLRYLIDYRRLSELQKANLDVNLKKYCDPRNRRKNADKTMLRDYSNWKNESQQIYGLLSTSAYFKILRGRLTLNTTDLGIFDPKTIRTGGGKKDYYAQHQVAKDANYHLHHIVPFTKARNKAEVLIVDDFKNLIYLHHKKHDEFDSKGGPYVKLRYDDHAPDLLFLDFNDSYILVNLSTDTKLNPNLISSMKDYNKTLLRKFYLYEG